MALTDPDCCGYCANHQSIHSDPKERKVSLKRAHKELDRALNSAHKEGFGYGFIEGVAAERLRIIELLRSVSAYGLQVVLNTEAETYQTEQTMDTEDLIRAIETDND